jgi:parallel beta-helix repeat protein
LEKKAASGIVLMLLLTNMLILAFNIQPVKAAGGIIIRADGAIDPPTAPILRDGDVYTFSDNIFDSIVVESSNIIVDGNGYTLQGSGSESGFELDGVNNVTIQNTNIQTFSYGINLYDSYNNTISGNNITDNNNGIVLDGSSNTISGNTITNNEFAGIRLDGSSDNTISGNTITNNEFAGIRLDGSSDNTISGNNITNNNAHGVSIYGSSDNTIYGNNITHNYVYNEIYKEYHYAGIYIYGSSNFNTISGNNITDNSYGIEVHGSDNTIFHNNFINNQNQIYLSDAINTWDDGYPSAGNYWSDYTGVDADGDGIGDTPYIIDENNQDNYPLVNQFIIPEFPSWTPLLIMLVAIVTMIVVYRRKLRN